MYSILLSPLKFRDMTYNIIGIFPSIDDAVLAARQLTKAGYIKQFTGFTENSKVVPESLIEDHFIDQNEIAVYTPNLNRAHKAKNIILKFGAEINKVTGIKCEMIQNPKPSKTSLVLFKKRKMIGKDQIKN